MDVVTDLLIAAREADVERGVRERRVRSVVETCRRRLFGIVPIGPACDSRAT